MIGNALVATDCFQEFRDFPLGTTLEVDVLDWRYQPHEDSTFQYWVNPR